MTESRAEAVARLRAFYAEGLGAPIEVHEVRGDGGASLFELHAYAVGHARGPQLYATCGVVACGLAAGCEVWLGTYYPYRAVLAKLEAIVRRGDPLRAMHAVKLDRPIVDTWFDHAIFAPAPVAHPGVPLLVAVPITAAEHAFAAREGPGALVQRIADASAMVFDPLRDCLIEPERTRPLRRTHRARILTAAMARFIGALRRVQQLRDRDTPDALVASDVLLARAALGTLEGIGWIEDEKPLPPDVRPLLASL